MGLVKTTMFMGTKMHGTMVQWYIEMEGCGSYWRSSNLGGGVPASLGDDSDLYSMKIN